MRKIKPVLLFCAVSLLLISSCKKEDETDPRDQFVGSYSISETYTLEGGGTGNDSYTITITKSSVNDKQIIINNLGNTVSVFGVQMNVTGTVSGSALTIETQVVALGDNTLTVTGTGSLNANLLLINYSLVGQWQGQCQGFKQ
jgi:hypothetical protein